MVRILNYGTSKTRYNDFDVQWDDGTRYRYSVSPYLTAKILAAYKHHKSTAKLANDAKQASEQQTKLKEDPVTAEELIELYISARGGLGVAVEDPSDPESRFKDQLVKGQPIKKDAVRQYIARDHNFAGSTDNSWMASTTEPFI